MSGLDAPPRKIGRYTLGGLVAAGGMAEVHLGQVRGAVGFSRTVAIKRMHPHLASDPDFASMFADEARLAARVRHPNVVATLDVVLEGPNLCIVMEYVEGVTLAQLLKLGAEQGAKMPPRIAVAIVRDALEGLHSAHQAVDADGKPLGIVHRDVSPQNVIVGVDGIARVLDFGIAKANVRLHETREGSGLKGKLAYMSPEQLDGAPVVRQSDIFAASIVLWEALTGRRAYGGASEGEVVTKILRGPPPLPSTVRDDLGVAYDTILMRGLAASPGERFESARQMAAALTAAGEPASPAEVGAWVERIAAAPLAERAQRVRQLETQLAENSHAGHASQSTAEPESDMTRAASPARLDGTGDVASDAPVAAHSRDPDLPPPSSAAAVAASTSSIATPAPEPSPAVVPPAPSPGSRLRVAALLIAACGMTAVAVLAWVDRGAARSSFAPSLASVPAPPLASSASSPSSASASASASSSSPASPSASAPAPASAPASPSAPVKIRKPPGRATSGIPRGGIPDHL